ncbi:MAG: sigma factor-like helix-turn-helix DNA-binding protein [Iamia sp.]
MTTAGESEPTPLLLAAPPMVGRGPELAAVAAVLDADGGRGVLLTGPIGVGKTRLATETMGRRAGTGSSVLRVIATSATADIPLGALAAIAPRGVRAGDGVVERVVAHLAEEAGDDPLLLVVDDVDHLDAQSHAVVRALVERRVARVVGTARSPLPPLPPPWTSPGVVRVELADLDADAVAEVLVATLGGPVAAELSRQLAVATGGNPLLLREALTLAGHNGALHRVDGIWSLADAERPVALLSEVVSGRLAPLPPAERDALELVAVAEVLPVGMADDLVGPVLLAELERAGLVRRDEVLGHPVVRPSHPFYGEALRSGLGPIARRHHARRLADAAQSAPEAVVDVMRVVAWRVAAGGEVEPDLLAQAAREARRRSEFSRAEDLATRAVEAGAGAPGLLLLGEIQNAVGRFEEADATFERVVAPLVAPGASGPTDDDEASLVGLAALALAFNRAWGLGQSRASRALLQDASAALAASPVAEVAVVADRRRELAADAAALAAFSGDPARAVAEVEALQVGSDEPSPRVAARLAFARAAGLLGVGRPEAAAVQSDGGLEALEGLPEGFGRATFTTNLLLTRIIGLAEAGRLAEAGEAAEATFRRSAASGFVMGQAVAAWARGRVEAISGRAVTAERWFREARLLERDLQTRGRRRWSLVGLGLALAAQGRVDEARQTLAVLDEMDLEAPVDDRWVLADEALLRAGLHISSGELSAAEDLLVATAAGAEEAGATGVAAVLWHSTVLTGVTPRTVADAASRLVSAESELDGEVHRCRAADAAAVLGRDPGARVQVATHLDQLGVSRLAHAVARAAAADATAAGQRGTARTAEEVAARVAADGEGGGWDVPGMDAALTGLGPRQREVVLLATQGHANQDIADLLGIAVRTVENHLHRAYAELDVDGRRGLVDLLAPEATAGSETSAPRR